MRISILLALLALGACTPADEDKTDANEIAPAEPSAIGSAQSGAEGQAMAEEQVKAAENETVAPPGSNTN